MGPKIRMSVLWQLLLVGAVSAVRGACSERDRHMSSKSNGKAPRHARVSVAVMVGSVLALLATPLTLGTASAAANADDASVTIDANSLNTNTQANTGGVSIQADYQTVTPATTSAKIYFTVLNTDGPDYNTATPNVGVPCGVVPAPGNGHVLCAIPDAAGAAGTDDIIVYADDTTPAPVFVTDPGNVLSGETTVTFSGAPSNVSLAASSSSAATGTCVPITLTATDSGGRRVDLRSFTLSAPAGVTFYDSTCEGASIGTSVMTNNNGTVTFGAAAGAPGGVLAITATAVDAPHAPGSTSINWIVPTTYALSSTPASIVGYVGTASAFTIQVTDPSGRPAEGVAVEAETSSIHDVVSCVAEPGHVGATTDHNGDIICNVANDGTAVNGDVVTVWIGGATYVPGTDPATRPTATFGALPNTNDAHFTLTCPNQSNGGAPSTTLCKVPTDQHSVTYTATVLDSSTNSPIPGVTVSFAGTSGGTGGPITPSNGVATTGADGTATFTVTDASPANLDDDLVTASIGNSYGAGPTTAEWLTRQASDITLTPLLQTVTRGGVVSVTGQLVDQFGSPFAVPGGSMLFGSSNPSTPLVPMSATGSATFTYTSTSTSVPDSITAHEGAVSSSHPALVEFVNGSTTASSVTVDTSGNGSSLVCPGTGAPNNTNLTIGVSDTTVCAIVKNSNSPAETLAGKSVTFTVSIGKVDATNPTATSTTTYTVPTGPNGIATAVVSSNTSGTQTVTATADGASGSGTLTYALPTVDKARNIVVSPTSASITAGNQQKFTWTVTDQFANPVAGATVSYTQAGAGLSGATSSGTLVTGADGTASVVITTASTDNGAGSVTGTLQQAAPPAPLNQCNDAAGVPASATTAGNCTAAATYTVLGSSLPTSVALKIAGGVTKGHQETVTATVTNANGSPAGNQVIRFLVTGANGLIGSSVTNSAGVATFTYLASHAGVDAITAYDDINNDNVQEGDEPGHHAKATITGVTDRPTIHLTSGPGSVTVHVATHPAMAKVLVTYYVKRYGAFRKIGTSRAGTLGRASMEFFFPKGVVRRFKARVNSKQGITGAKTVAKTITVR
jgi:Bacterial Ig-like domain (group 1)